MPKQFKWKTIGKEKEINKWKFQAKHIKCKTKQGHVYKTTVQKTCAPLWARTSTNSLNN